MNPFQKTKNDNLKAVVKLVASLMPNGIEDRKLRAAIMFNLGTSRATANDYLEVLADAGKLELDEKAVWRVVA